MYTMARRIVSHGQIQTEGNVYLFTYQQSNYQRPYWEMGGPQLNTETGEDEVDRENDCIPTSRDLTIVRHQFSVDVRLFPQRTSKVDPDRFPEVQYRVHDGCCNGSEGKSICDRKRGAGSRGY